MKPISSMFLDKKPVIQSTTQTKCGWSYSHIRLSGCAQPRPQQQLLHSHVQIVLATAAMAVQQDQDMAEQERDNQKQWQKTLMGTPLPENTMLDFTVLDPSAGGFAALKKTNKKNSHHTQLFLSLLGLWHSSSSPFQLMTSWSFIEFLQRPLTCGLHNLPCTVNGHFWPPTSQMGVYLFCHTSKEVIDQSKRLMPNLKKCKQWRNVTTTRRTNILPRVTTVLVSLQVI